MRKQLMLVATAVVVLTGCQTTQQLMDASQAQRCPSRRGARSSR